MTAARDDGMQLALDAVPDWADLAEVGITYLAWLGDPFTADDLIRLVGLPRESAPNRNNAVGAVLAGAARRGAIRRVSETSATRPLSRGRRLTVWEGTPR